VPNVITDTSPVQYLYQASLLELLPTLYDQILVPQGVADELAIGRFLGVALPDPADLSWMTIRPGRSGAILPLVTDLGLGEREALALAVETTDSLVLLDDALARRYARFLGIEFTGTLGILLKAKRSGYLASVAPILDQLEALRFRLDPSTRATVLKLAGELSS